jgi:ribosome-associated translation inhibitor RaiA
MLFQLNTDSHIKAREALAQNVEVTVTGGLERFSRRITRVEVHLSDVNGQKGGDADIRCVIEARPSGHQPLTATHHAGDVEDAISGAMEKLERVLESTFAKLDNRKIKGRPDLTPPEDELEEEQD